MLVGQKIKDTLNWKHRIEWNTIRGDENDIRNASRRPVTLLGATAIDDKLQDEVQETIEQQLEALSIALRICWMMRDEIIFFWLIFFLHVVYFQVLQISCMFMFPQIYLGSHVFLIHILFRWHAATKAPTGRNTCCSEGFTVSCEGRMSDTTRKSHSRFESGFAVLHLKQLETACNLLGLRFGCSLVTKSTQPSVLPCRASCSRKKWTISSLTATRSRGRAIPKNPENKKTQMSKRMCTRRTVSKFSVPT